MTAAPSNSNAPQGICPTCGAPAVADFRPFCSKRCSDIDLHKWLGGEYAIPTDEGPDDPRERDLD